MSIFERIGVSVFSAGARLSAALRGKPLTPEDEELNEWYGKAGGQGLRNLLLLFVAAAIVVVIVNWR